MAGAASEGSGETAGVVLGEGILLLKIPILLCLGLVEEDSHWGGAVFLRHVSVTG